MCYDIVVIKLFKNMCGIYYIKNKINNNKYVGKTKNKFKKRWSSHKTYLRKGTSGCHILQNAWNKYGEENFEFGVIVEGNFNSLELKKLEEIFIKLYGYYNIQKISRVNSQYKEKRKKLSKAAKKRWADPEYKTEIKKVLRGTSWIKYEEVKEFWRDKSNGRNGNCHPGKTKIMNKFNLTRGVTQLMLKELKKDETIKIKEGINKNEIYKYWLDRSNSNQSKYKHPGRRDLAKTFNISSNLASELIKEFKLW